MRNAIFALFFGLATLLGMQAGSPTSGQAAEPDLAAQVRAAWERRSDRTKSIECDCTLETSRFDGPRAAASDAFGPGGTPSKDRQIVPLASTFSFCRAGDKLAYREQGDAWDEFTGTRRTCRYRSSA